MDLSDPYMEFCNNSDMNGIDVEFDDDIASTLPSTSTSTSASNELIKVESKSKCGYLVRSWQGELGDQMFAYASLYGVAKNQTNEDGKKIAFAYGMENLEKAFDNLSLYRCDIRWSCMRGRIDVLLSEHWVNNDCCRYVPIGQLPCDGKNYQIDNTRKSFKYFAHVKDEIVREFSNFKAPIMKKCDQLLEDVFIKSNLHRENSMTVAVHLRRVLGYVNLWQKFIPVTLDYFQRVVKFFEDIFSNRVQVQPELKHLVFVVFTDGRPWTPQAIEQVNISNPNSTHFVMVRRTSSPVDMCAMSKFDHIAISSGSFDIWSAILNRGIVAYMKEYAAERYNVTGENFFLPHWIPL